jgi:hypothetical protein
MIKRCCSPSFNSRICLYDPFHLSCLNPILRVNMKYLLTSRYFGANPQMVQIFGHWRGRWDSYLCSLFNLILKNEIMLDFSPSTRYYPHTNPLS